MRRWFVILIALSSISITRAQSIPPLLTAIKANDIAEVRRLIEKNSSLTEEDADGDQPLMYAALYSSMDCMKLLLDKGANPNVKNKLGETPLIWCAQDSLKLDLLLRYGADVNATTKDGNTILLVASVGSTQSGIVRLLLDKGADPLVKNVQGETGLMRVALYGDTATAAIFLDRGVALDQKNNNQETALLMSCRTANDKMVSWLLRHGADANLLDNYKATALSYAVVVCGMTAISDLIKRTKYINQADIDGMTFLMWAAYREDDQPQIIQMLLDNGAVPGVKNEKGQTALSWAIKKGNTRVVELLKKKMAL